MTFRLWCLHDMFACACMTFVFIMACTAFVGFHFKRSHSYPERIKKKEKEEAGGSAHPIKKPYTTVYYCASHLEVPA